MNDEFYAVIKLVSGEEIFSKVSPCEEEDRILLILEDPIKIEKVLFKKFNMPISKITPWIELSDDDMYIIDMDKIITITESKNKNIINIHKKYVKEKNKKTTKSKITESMGYISSVTEARDKLEELFKM